MITHKKCWEFKSEIIKLQLILQHTTEYFDLHFSTFAPFGHGAETPARRLIAHISERVKKAYKKFLVFTFFLHGDEWVLWISTSLLALPLQRLVSSVCAFLSVFVTERNKKWWNSWFFYIFYFLCGFGKTYDSSHSRKGAEKFFRFLLFIKFNGFRLSLSLVCVDFIFSKSLVRP